MENNAGQSSAFSGKTSAIRFQTHLRPGKMGAGSTLRQNSTPSHKTPLKAEANKTAILSPERSEIRSSPQDESVRLADSKLACHAIAYSGRRREARAPANPKSEIRNSKQ